MTTINANFIDRFNEVELIRAQEAIRILYVITFI